MKGKLKRMVTKWVHGKVAILQCRSERECLSGKRRQRVQSCRLTRKTAQFIWAFFLGQKPKEETFCFSHSISSV